MKLIVFGLSVSSSWGNGHATLWRGLIRALSARGHRVVFFERDVPYYAAHRDLNSLDGGELVLYRGWDDALGAARRHLGDADAAMVTSYCPDARAATGLMLDSAVPLRTFYDLDTPVTLRNLEAGRGVDYIGPRGLRDFDVVLSYTGGKALEELQRRLGARRVAPLYGSVDPSLHRPVSPRPDYAADLGYLGTYSEDRQPALDALFLEPARRLPGRRMVLGGSLYPECFPWCENIRFIPHVPPPDHSAFYCSSKLTLSVTRGPMAEMGYCPSGRLFEASACGVPIITDEWEGLEQFFEPGSEILVARRTEDVTAALEMSEGERERMARAARERTLACHTAARRAVELEAALEAAR